MYVWVDGESMSAHVWVGVYVCGWWRVGVRACVLGRCVVTVCM